MNAVADHSVVWKNFLRLLSSNPLIPLILLLLALILVLEIMQPGIVNSNWLGNTIKFAIPLAMLAACQTATMLTGGIDLSVGTIATITAFVTATLTPQLGAPAAILIALACSLLTGLINGFGIAFCS